MKTLDILDAADFLKMHPEVLRRKAHNGTIPGRKAGKRWIFIEEHLADWVSGRYPEQRRDLQVIDEYNLKEHKQCQSTSVKIHGGYKIDQAK